MGGGQHTMYFRFDNPVAMSRAAWILRNDLSLDVRVEPIPNTDFLRLVGQLDEIDRVENELRNRRLRCVSYQEDMYQALRRGERRRRQREEAAQGKADK